MVVVVVASDNVCVSIAVVASQNTVLQDIVELHENDRVSELF